MALANIVLEQMATGAIAVDDAGIVSLYNHAAQEILGVPAEGVLGRTCASLAEGAEPIGAIARALAAGLAGGHSRSASSSRSRPPAGGACSATAFTCWATRPSSP